MKLTRIGFNYTHIDNEFIDSYMLQAKGEYVKVYIMFIRLMNDPDFQSSDIVSSIADLLGCTEKTVNMAFDYWISKGLILSDSPVIPKAVSKDFKQLLHIADRYFGRKLTLQEVNTLYYIYDELHISFELCDYLLEYCCMKQKMNFNYIKKIAENWSKDNVTTVDEAKLLANPYYSLAYNVLSSFHIKGRTPTASDASYCEKWTTVYKMSDEMIMKACEWTLDKIHKPSFTYCDKILNDWHLNNIHTLEDIHKMPKKENTKSSTTKTVKPSKYAELEKQLLAISTK